MNTAWPQLTHGAWWIRWVCRLMEGHALTCASGHPRIVLCCRCGAEFVVRRRI